MDTDTFTDPARDEALMEWLAAASKEEIAERIARVEDGIHNVINESILMIDGLRAVQKLLAEALRDAAPAEDSRPLLIAAAKMAMVMEKIPGGVK